DRCDDSRRDDGGLIEDESHRAGIDAENDDKDDVLGRGKRLAQHGCIPRQMRRGWHCIENSTCSIAIFVRRWIPSLSQRKRPGMIPTKIKQADPATIDLANRDLDVEDLAEHAGARTPSGAKQGLDGIASTQFSLKSANSRTLAPGCKTLSLR